jgi:hypothetical protein
MSQRFGHAMQVAAGTLEGQRFSVVCRSAGEVVLLVSSHAQVVKRLCYSAFVTGRAL